MNIPQLQITTTRGILGLRTTPGTQEIEQPRAILSQQQPAAILEISTTQAQLSLDTTEVRADLDLKSVFKRTEEFAQLGREGSSEGTGRRAAQGRQLMDISKGRNVIKEQAVENGSRPMKSLGIQFIPNRLKLEMSFQPGSLDINIETKKPVNDVTIQNPIYHYTPSKLTGEMEQWPSIQIDVKW
ncbi:DUF6470 family protein [Psychrobacillus vulpis]|uniref:YviE n=1 Tax=Psychrobacillus vulpis TaxID=2325572 RepID=A0A544TIU6_9BACI|nr:DUF6470 family protein [Psychrobacillus vulpis]TQR17374.1 hypothetical protein FG384_17950 [Psychrobacillus vulpis]